MFLALPIKRLFGIKKVFFNFWNLFFVLSRKFAADFKVIFEMPYGMISAEFSGVSWSGTIKFYSVSQRWLTMRCQNTTRYMEALKNAVLAELHYKSQFFLYPRRIFPEIGAKIRPEKGAECLYLAIAFCTYFQT